MKKVFLALVLIFGLTTFAQGKKEGKVEREKMSPEQQVELQVKRMKLDLDLNDKQSSEIKAILTKQTEKRATKRAEMQAKKAEGKKPSKDEIFKMKNAMLDEQIANKTEMKKILNAEQFAKWEQNQLNRKKELSNKIKKARKERKLENSEK
jgi:protein CpxP